MKRPVRRCRIEKKTRNQVRAAGTQLVPGLPLVNKKKKKKNPTSTASTTPDPIAAYTLHANRRWSTAIVEPMSLGPCLGLWEVTAIASWRTWNGHMTRTTYSFLDRAGVMPDFNFNTGWVCYPCDNREIGCCYPVDVTEDFLEIELDPVDPCYPLWQRDGQFSLLRRELSEEDTVRITRDYPDVTLLPFSEELPALEPIEEQPALEPAV